jgi:uncharacterized protein YciI
MFMVLLKFGPGRAQAHQWMDEHKRWLQRGFDDGVFLLAGSLADAQGGAVLASRTDLDALTARVREDPFVVHGVVEADIHAITPSRVAPQLASCMAGLG